VPTLAFMVLLAAAGDFIPARLSAGQLPAAPGQSVEWNQAVFELSIARDGSVRRVETLSPSTPFVAALGNSLRQWEFTPAEESNGKKVAAVEGRVLVAGILRPPNLQVAVPAPTTKPATSAAVPKPLRMAPPAYPPKALLDGMVAVELAVDSTGTVGSVRVVRSSPAFDEAAVAAAKMWEFRPAVRNGRPVSAYVYLVFGFRQPVIA